MKLVTYRQGDDERLGALVGDRIADLRSVAPSMLDFIRGGAESVSRARAVLLGQPATVPLASVRLLAPLRPGKVLCSGINYKSHADENPNAKMPSYPLFFAKVSTALAAPEDEIEAPTMTRELDYEVEFAAVIGKRLRRPAESEVMD
jgi:2-keto-4-pentenoate hydratase/2-oxohepta-3-ene-1,7-dioic acid hydratase in catechol pathway